jgi:hypothetical protein
VGLDPGKPGQSGCMTASCGVPPPGAPVVGLTLVGSGEGALRLEKRLRCAAAGVGLALNLEVRKDHGAMGVRLADTPAVLLEGRTVFAGLPRTEEIEAWLRQTCRSANEP